MEEPNGERPTIGARRGMSWSERIRAEDSYGILLLLIGASLMTAAFAQRSVFLRSLVPVLLGAILLFAFWTTRSGRHLFRVSLVVVPGAVLVSVVLTTSESDAGAGALAIASAALSLSAIGAITRRLVARGRIDAATILGALATYLLIGSFFSYVYAATSLLGEGEFFTQGVSTAIDLLYFSFITMTTVGYGDLTPATDLGRMLAVTQALIGQLYLVTVVALVVSNFGRRRTQG
jgi:Ion channel